MPIGQPITFSDPDEGGRLIRWYAKVVESDGYKLPFRRFAAIASNGSGVIIDNLALAEDSIEGNIFVANGDEGIPSPVSVIVVDSDGKVGSTIIGGEEDARNAMLTCDPSDYES